MVTISDEEEKALLIYMVDIQEWIDNAIHNRARQAIDQIISENTDRQPKKMPIEDRNKIINDLTSNMKTAYQKKMNLLLEN